MEVILAGLVVVIFGLVAGSFAGATVWRLRARQLTEDKRAGEKVPVKELARLKPLTKATLATDRSQCLNCQHKLASRDLIPLISWISTRGKCRYCKEPIGNFEPLIELGSAALFVAFYIYWLSASPASSWLLLAWVPVLVMFIILFAYDLKWFILPDEVMFPLIGLAAVIASYYVAISSVPISTALSAFSAVLILGGLYLALWLVSKGNWVGFGDVKLGLALGLLLVDWRLAFLTLFLANLIGTLIVLPGLISKKMSRKSQIPFGPLLIAGFFISLFAGNGLIDWYVMASNSLVQTTLML